MSQTGISLLKMNRNGIMHAASDSASFQLPHQFVPIRNSNSIDMINVTRVFSLGGGNDVFNHVESGGIASSMRAASFVSALEMFQFNCKTCALNRVHPAVPANYAVMVF